MFSLMAAWMKSVGRIFICCMLMMLAIVPLSGQEVIAFEQLFRYSARESDMSAKTTNHFLQLIAASKGGLRAFTSYRFSGHLELELREGAEGKITPVLWLRETVVSGDHTYRDFDLGRVLIPDHMAFRLEIQDAQGQRLHEEYLREQPLPLPGESWQMRSLSLNGTPPFRAIVSELLFSYSDEVSERYDAWLNALEAYYKSSTQLQQADQLSQKLSFTDPGTLMLDEFSLCEAEHLMGLIKSADFQQQLDLSVHDPEQLLYRKELLSLRLDSLRRGFNQAISRIDQLFFEKGNELLSGENIADALDQYHSALVYNPFHIPSHLAIVGQQLDSLGKQAALERTGEVLAIMYPDAGLKTQATALADSLCALYFEEALLLMEDGRYLDALKNLEQLFAFCRKVEGQYPCPDELDAHLRAGHYGMFQSFMKVSEQAFYHGRLSLSLTYLQNALAYYDMHTDFIPDRKFAMLLMQRIANRYQRQGDQAFREGAYESAAAAFETLIGLCDSYAFLICVPDLPERYQRALDMLNAP